MLESTKKDVLDEHAKSKECPQTTERYRPDNADYRS